MSDKGNEEEIFKLEHDQAFNIQKVALYGLEGSTARMVKVNSDGTIPVTL